MKLTTAIARNLELPSGKTDHFVWGKDFPDRQVLVNVRPLVGLRMGLASENWQKYRYFGASQRSQFPFESTYPVSVRFWINQ